SASSAAPHDRRRARWRGTSSGVGDQELDSAPHLVTTEAVRFLGGQGRRRAPPDARHRLLSVTRQDDEGWSTMEYRQLGGSGLRVSTLTLGTMTFGGRGGFRAVGATDGGAAR